MTALLLILTSALLFAAGVRRSRLLDVSVRKEQKTVMDTIPRLRASTLAGRPPDAQHRLQGLFADAWETGCISEERIRTGCIYEVQPAATFSLCVLRFDPRLSGRRQVPFHEWWPELAPTAPLVKGYRTLDTHGQRAISWAAFAYGYFAELDALPTRLLLSLVEELCDLPSRYTSVTLLGCEHPTAADEERVRCHRRLLRAWLLGQANTVLDSMQRTSAAVGKGVR